MKLNAFAYLMALTGWTMATMGMMLARDGMISPHELDILSGLSLSMMLIIILACLWSTDAENRKLKEEADKMMEPVKEADPNDAFGPGWFRS